MQEIFSRGATWNGGEKMFCGNYATIFSRGYFRWRVISTGRL
jgi:hypothetical protein